MENEVLNAWRLLKFVIEDKAKKIIPDNDFAAGEIEGYKSVMRKIDQLIKLEVLAEQNEQNDKTRNYDGNGIL